ncbi:hypothetical protein EC973_005923 [Apophysomyces ossiformis]|uniref:Uncharacterized protein n=1 Tax=Apophysomyces ossiformis TaxID=679940 RepID=A0A8H7ERW9_9FUNG|nr:hypothetical protein EC973_005923 [Apophysomyces ossiformis]
MHISFRCNELTDTSCVRTSSLPHQKDYMGSALSILCNVALYSDRRHIKLKAMTQDGPDRYYRAAQTLARASSILPIRDSCSLADQVPVCSAKASTIDVQPSCEMYPNTRACTNILMPSRLLPLETKKPMISTPAPDSRSLFQSYKQRIEGMQRPRYFLGDSMLLSTPRPPPTNKYLAVMEKFRKKRSLLLHESSSETFHPSGSLEEPAIKRLKLSGNDQISYAHCRSARASEMRSPHIPTNTASKIREKTTDTTRAQYLHISEYPSCTLYPVHAESTTKPDTVCKYTTTPYKKLSSTTSALKERSGAYSSVISLPYTEFGCSRKPVVTPLHPHIKLENACTASPKDLHEQSDAYDDVCDVHNLSVSSPCQKFQCVACNTNYVAHDDEEGRRCNRCKRHYLIFNMEWPVRRLYRKRGRPKQATV